MWTIKIRPISYLNTTGRLVLKRVISGFIWLLRLNLVPIWDAPKYFSILNDRSFLNPWIHLLWLLLMKLFLCCIKLFSNGFLLRYSLFSFRNGKEEISWIRYYINIDLGISTIWRCYWYFIWDCVCNYNCRRKCLIKLINRVCGSTNN